MKALAAARQKFHISVKAARERRQRDRGEKRENETAIECVELSVAKFNSTKDTSRAEEITKECRF